MEQELLPVKETKRLMSIDAARGFAIFGIFIVNIGAFSSPYFLYGDATMVWTSKLDYFILSGIDIFFQASFYTLFSLLFGFGLGIMKERIQARGGKLYPFLIRRLMILLGFGVLHGFFLWHGDILFSYAIVGMLALLFIRISSRKKIMLASILLGGAVGLITLLYYAARDYLRIMNQAAIERAFSHYQSSNLSIIWQQNFHDWLFSNHPINLIFLIFIILPFFLFGIVLAEKRWLHEPGNYQSTLKRLWVVSFVLFIALKWGPYAFGNPLWFSLIQDNVGGLFSALFYIISITMLVAYPFGKKLLQPFSFVGRMAITNYILQSIISFVLFYGFGLGLYGSISPLTGVGIVILVFICQIIWSKWWLQKFRFGPLEWIWRSLTYGKWQPFKKTSSIK